MEVFKTELDEQDDCLQRREEQVQQQEITCEQRGAVLRIRSVPSRLRFCQLTLTADLPQRTNLRRGAGKRMRRKRHEHWRKNCLAAYASTPGNRRW
jgi:hypothetical protein